MNLYAKIIDNIKFFFVHNLNEISNQMSTSFLFYKFYHIILSNMFTSRKGIIERKNRLRHCDRDWKREESRALRASKYPNCISVIPVHQIKTVCDPRSTVARFSVN